MLVRLVVQFENLFVIDVGLLQLFLCEFECVARKIFRRLHHDTLRGTAGFVRTAVAIGHTFWRGAYGFVLFSAGTKRRNDPGKQKQGDYPRFDRHLGSLNVGFSSFLKIHENHLALL